VSRPNRFERFKELDARLFQWEKAHPILTWLVAAGLAIAFLTVVWAVLHGR
jgi:hypothetical protein